MANHRQPSARPPFSAIALSAGDRLMLALAALCVLWLAVSWALDWWD